jgi:PAS domain-containing protein
VAPPLPVPPEPAPPLQVHALQSLAEAIVATDLDGQLTFLNPAAERLLGIGRAQALGRKLEEIVGLVDQADRKLLADPVLEAIGGWPGALLAMSMLRHLTRKQDHLIMLSAIIVIHLTAWLIWFLRH